MSATLQDVKEKGRAIVVRPHQSGKKYRGVGNGAGDQPSKGELYTELLLLQVQSITQ